VSRYKHQNCIYWTRILESDIRHHKGRKTEVICWISFRPIIKLHITWFVFWTPWTCCCVYAIPPWIVGNWEWVCNLNYNTKLIFGCTFSGEGTSHWNFKSWIWWWLWNVQLFRTRQVYGLWMSEEQTSRKKVIIWRSSIKSSTRQYKFGNINKPKLCVKAIPVTGREVA
jgi:hypothetical protein